MAFDLSSISSGVQLKPPKIVLYGVAGVGKTTLAAGAPNPIGLLTEDGLGVLDVPHFPLIRKYEELVEAIATLAKEDHPYNTVFLDSIDHLEPLIWKRVADDHGKESVEDLGYGKGYVHALDYWREILSGFTALRNKGMAVVLIAHNEVKRYENPETDPYDRHQIKLHRSASALVQEWADAVLFANWHTSVTKADAGFNKQIARGITSGRRLLHTTEKPAYLAKNRYGLPETIELSWDAFDAALQKAITDQSTTAQEAA